MLDNSYRFILLFIRQGLTTFFSAKVLISFSFESIALLTFTGIFITLFGGGLSSSGFDNLHFQICKCLSLHNTNFVLKGNVERGAHLISLVVCKIITFIIIFFCILQRIHPSQHWVCLLNHTFAFEC